MGTSLAILALVVISPFHAGSALKGDEAVKQLVDFEKQFQATARASGKSIDRRAYSEAVKQKAEDLLQGVEVANVPAPEGLDWAHVLDAASRYQDSITVLDRFIASGPSGDDSLKAKIAEVGDYRNLRKQDKAAEILLTLKPTTEEQAIQLQRQDGAQAQLIARDQGDDAALKFLDSVTPNFKGFNSKVLTSARATVLMPSTRVKLIGSSAPGLTVMPEKYGAFAGLDGLKGKVVILDFFAHWCPPCIASMPDMRKLTDDLGDKVSVVGVTAYYGYYGKKQGIEQKEEFADMKGFMDEHKIDHPVVYIDRSEFAAYGVSGIPEFVLIGKDGKVKKIQLGYGPKEFADFRAAVEAETK